MSINQTLFSTILILSIGIFVSNIEYIFLIKKYKKYSFIGESMSFALRPYYKILKINYLYKDWIFISILFLSCVFTIIMLLCTPRGYTWSCSIIALFILNLLIGLRDVFGREGSDQMALIILLSLFLTTQFWATDWLSKIGILFIALQSALAYFTSGLSKLVSPRWRSGSAIFDIMNTSTFGDAGITRMLKKYRFMELFICWTVILLELSFPLVFFLSTEFMISFLMLCLLFHILNAILMGLNNFIWVFVATYPSIYYIHHQLH